MSKRQIVSAELASTERCVLACHDDRRTRARSSFVSGMVAKRPDRTVAGIGDVGEHAPGLREPQGGDGRCRRHARRHLPRCDVYVRNMEHFPLIHEVRRQYFNEPLPASTMVEVTKMTSPDYLIEIERDRGRCTTELARI